MGGRVAAALAIVALLLVGAPSEAAHKKPVSDYWVAFATSQSDCCHI